VDTGSEQIYHEDDAHHFESDAIRVHGPGARIKYPSTKWTHEDTEPSPDDNLTHADLYYACLRFMFFSILLESTFSLTKNENREIFGKKIKKDLGVDVK